MVRFYQSQTSAGAFLLVFGSSSCTYSLNDVASHNTTHIAQKRVLVMGEDIKWLIGILASIAVSFIIALIASFRSLAVSIKADDDALHERINRTRDDYVHRVGLDGHVNQLREGMKELKEETWESAKETNKRLDQVLAALAQDKK